MFMRDLYDKMTDTDKHAVMRVVGTDAMHKICQAHIEVFTANLALLNPSASAEMLKQDYLKLRMAIDTWKEFQAFFTVVTNEAIDLGIIVNQQENTDEQV